MGFTLGGLVKERFVTSRGKMVQNPERKRGADVLLKGN